MTRKRRKTRSKQAKARIRAKHSRAWHRTHIVIEAEDGTCWAYRIEDIRANIESRWSAMFERESPWLSFDEAMDDGAGEDDHLN